MKRKSYLNIKIKCCCRAYIFNSVMIFKAYLNLFKRSRFCSGKTLANVDRTDPPFFL